MALRDPLPWPEIAQIAMLAERAGYEQILVPEFSGREAFATVAGLASVTRKIRLGTGVVPLDSRAPEVIAMSAATVAELSSGRFILGLGAGRPAVGSLARVRETVAFLRDALAGRSVTTPDGDEFFEPGLAPPPVQIWLAALSPKMMALAGEIADGVLLTLCPPERVAFARERIREGARQARRHPDEVTIAVYLRACICQDEEQAISAIRSSALPLMTSPGYSQQLAESGLNPARDLNAVLRAVALVGSPDEASARVENFRRAGANLPIIYPVANREPIASIQTTIRVLAGFTSKSTPAADLSRGG